MTRNECVGGMDSEKAMIAEWMSQSCKVQGLTEATPVRPAWMGDEPNGEVVSTSVDCMKVFQLVLEKTLAQSWGGRVDRLISVFEHGEAPGSFQGGHWRRELGGLLWERAMMCKVLVNQHDAHDGWWFAPGYQRLAIKMLKNRKLQPTPRP